MASLRGTVQCEAFEGLQFCASRVCQLGEAENASNSAPQFFAGWAEGPLCCSADAKEVRPLLSPASTFPTASCSGTHGLGA
jgi:hypothetical protein